MYLKKVLKKNTSAYVIIILAVAESGDSLTSLRGGGELGGYISHNRDNLYDNYNY